MKAAFLDRDGIINVDTGYVSRIEDFEFCPYIIELLNFLSDQRFALFICTNQSGLARGLFNDIAYENLTRSYLDDLNRSGIHITEIVTCPHHPEYTGICNCRKPLPGMFEYLISKYDIKVKSSIAIGDSIRDLEAANAVGIKRLFQVNDKNEIKNNKLGQSFASLGQLLQHLKLEAINA